MTRAMLFLVLLLTLAGSATAGPKQPPIGQCPAPCGDCTCPDPVVNCPTEIQCVCADVCHRCVGLDLSRDAAWVCMRHEDPAKCRRLARWCKRAGC